MKIVLLESQYKRVKELLNDGYTSNAILNYIALLGWHSSTDDEIYSLPKYICQSLDIF